MPYLNKSDFLKRYFKKGKPEELTFSDFQDFVRQEIEEHQTLEYKPRGILVDKDGRIVKGEKKGFSALAKSVAGFANAEGGLLLLGVKEKSQRHKGKIVKIKPGKITPFPPTITREIIENQLQAKISFPIDSLTIIPLRTTKKGKQSVFVLEILPSLRAPHRVDELYYYQRYNFSTLEMKHYQIADLFGKRFAPDLEIGIGRIKGANEDRGHFSLKPLIFNRGRAVAKYTTCVCTVIDPGIEIFQSNQWNVRENKKSCQFATGIRTVIYPETPLDTGYIEFQPEENRGGKFRKVALEFYLYAENMTAKHFPMEININN